MTADRIGGDIGRSKTTVTCWPSADAQRSSRSTSPTIARLRFFHQPSGRAPITFMASTIHRTRPTVRARPGSLARRGATGHPAPSQDHAPTDGGAHAAPAASPRTATGTATGTWTAPSARRGFRRSTPISRTTTSGRSRRQSTARAEARQPVVTRPGRRGVWRGTDRPGGRSPRDSPAW